MPAAPTAIDPGRLSHRAEPPPAHPRPPKPVTRARPAAKAPAPLRHLVLVLGDQLDLEASAFDGFDAAQDRVWMAEVAEESTHVWSSQPRTAVFLAAMRHFAIALQDAGRPLVMETRGWDDGRAICTRR